MLHINLEGMEHRAACKHTFCPYTYPQPLGLGQNIFLKVAKSHNKNKLSNLKEWSIEQHASTYSVLIYTLDPCSGIKRSCTDKFCFLLNLALKNSLYAFNYDLYDIQIELRGWKTGLMLCNL